MTHGTVYVSRSTDVADDGADGGLDGFADLFRDDDPGPLPDGVAGQAREKAGR